MSEQPNFQPTTPVDSGSQALAEALQGNIEKIGMPKWTPEEQTFAKAIQKLTQGKEEGLTTTSRKLRTPRPVSITRSRSRPRTCHTLQRANGST